jgi:tRNA A-37 threonylcarbamoyl transferase component Bud32
LKLSSKATVLLEEFPFKGIKKKVVVKHVVYSRVFFFSLRGLKFILIRIFLGTRGRRAWIAGNGFAVRGIPTPQPIALVERKFFGFTRDDILLTEYIDDSLSVNDYISKHFSNEYNPTESPLLKEGMGVKKKRLFIEELARLVRSFHDTGIYHSDLSGRNIIVREGQPGHWEMYIIDLDAVSLWKKLTLRRRLKDLARINNVCPDCITNTDRMRFFKAYFRGRSPRDHEYIERIFKLTEVIRCRRSRRRQRKRSRLIHRTRQVG